MSMATAGRGSQCRHGAAGQPGDGAVMTRAALLQTVCFCSGMLPLRPLSRALCLERSIVIPQASGLSAAARNLANPTRGSLLMKTTPQNNPSLTRQLIQEGPSCVSGEGQGVG